MLSPLACSLSLVPMLSIIFFIRICRDDIFISLGALGAGSLLLIFMPKPMLPGRSGLAASIGIMPSLANNECRSWAPAAADAATTDERWPTPVLVPAPLKAVSTAADATVTDRCMLLSMDGMACCLLFGLGGPIL